MNEKTRRWVLTSGAVTAAAIIGVAAVVVFGDAGGNPSAQPYVPPKTSPQITAEAFLKAIVSDPAKAANETDNPTAAGAALAAQATGMGKSVYSAKLRPGDASAEKQTADVSWALPTGKPFAYSVELNMKQVKDQWKVHWTPTVLHPQLTDGAHLTFRVSVADGALLDRNGTALATGTVPPALHNAITGAIGDLKGADGWEVGIASGSAFTALDGVKPEVGQKVTVTIDPAAQKSAQAAVDAVQLGAAIVAIDAQTTEILAVASNDALGSNPFGGQYAPGSTMKIVTAASAMQNGLVQNGTTPVDCPAEAWVGTRHVKNLNFGYPNKIAFSTAFARSCNTTFGALGHKLAPGALPATAKQFGLGTDYVMVGADSNTGKVPPASGDQQVENSFGQGTVTASPFGMALVAATVASGKKPMPTLVRGKAPEVTAGGAAPPAAGVLQALRGMMQECVRSGTATALAKYGAVHGKTGTAESNEGSHGWFVGYRGNVAFAVFIKSAGSSDPALSAAGQFLSGIR